MSTLDLAKQALAKIKRNPALAHVADDIDLIDDIGLDSLETLQFLLELEDVLGARIDYDRLEFQMLRSLRTLASFLDGAPC